MKNKCAIYVRVSTHWQVDKDSLQVQKRELQAYSEIVLGISECTIFEDPGYSGKNTDRPAFQQMMNELRTGAYSHLLVWKIDRISRNLLDFSEMYKELKELGVTFVSKNEQFDTSSAIGEAMLKIILVFAELERGMTSERVTATMISRATNGQWNGGRVPYGYDYDKKTKLFSINEDEAKIYYAAVELYEENQSLIYAAKTLNQLGYKSRAGNDWSPVSIHKMLTNVFYLGHMRYNVHSEGNGYSRKDESEWITIEDHHPALIKQDRFDHINYVLKHNKKGEFLKLKAVTNAGNVHIFSNLVRCGACGSNMTASKDRRRANGYQPSMYICGRRKISNSCTNKYATDLKLIPLTLCVISNLLKNKDEILSSKSKERQIALVIEDTGAESISDQSLDQILNQYNSKLQPVSIAIENKNADDGALAAQYRSRINKLGASLNRLKTLYLYGEEAMPVKDYILEKERITSEITELERKLTELDAPLSQDDFDRKASYFLVVSKLLEKKHPDFIRLAQSIDQKLLHEFIHQIISRITVLDGIIESIEFTSGIKIEFQYKKV